MLNKVLNPHKEDPCIGLTDLEKFELVHSILRLRYEQGLPQGVGAVGPWILISDGDSKWYKVRIENNQLEYIYLDNNDNTIKTLDGMTMDDVINRINNQLHPSLPITPEYQAYLKMKRNHGGLYRYSEDEYEVDYTFKRNNAFYMLHHYKLTHESIYIRRPIVCDKVEDMGMKKITWQEFHQAIGTLAK